MTRSDDRSAQGGADEAPGYEIRASISVEAMEYFMAVQHDLVAGVLDGIEDRLDEPEELRRYLRDVREINEETRLDRDDEWASFVSRLQEDDALYLFEFREDYYQDFGILVERNGEIVFRTIWESVAPEGFEPESIGETEFDRL